MSRVDRFVKKKDVDLRDTPFGNDSQPSNHHALTAQQRRAKDLRMKVPVTRLEAKPESNVSSLSALAKALAARYPLRSDSESGSVSTFRRDATLLTLSSRRVSLMTRSLKIAQSVPSMA